MSDTHEVISSENKFEGKWFSVRRETLIFPNGLKVERDVVDHPDAVVVIPVDQERNVLLVEQYRNAAGAMLLELPAGTVEEGEDPLVSAQRELREETGVAARQLIPVGNFWASPGFCTERMWMFLGLDLENSPLEPDLDEDISVKRIPFEEVLEMAARGLIVDGKTIAGLFLAQNYLANR